MTSRKIPQHVARELKRHVQKPSGNNSNNKKAYALLGCVTFTAFAAAMPYLATKWTGNLNAKDNPLTAAQTRRGAFNNSGTRDVGKDPNWDFERGTYKRTAELQQMLADGKPDTVEHEDELVRQRR